MADREVAAGAPLYQCKSCEGMFPSGAFYASNLARCKECVKASVRKNRAENLSYYRAYDRLRYRESPERKERCIAMGKTTPMHVRVEKQRERRRENPDKYYARQFVANAIRDGRLAKASTCYFCGCEGKLQAHHHDYSKPLDVFWLCTACHGKLHAINGDFHYDRKANP